MDQVLEYINKFGEVMTVLWPMLAAIAPVLASLWGKLSGTTKVIINKVKDAAGDRIIDDHEAAQLFWMLISKIVGYWPNKSVWVLKAAPVDHINELKADGFITQAQADEALSRRKA